MDDYWNHNTAYHPELLAAVPESCQDVLDVGSGDGLLLQKLAARSRRVTGIDSDAQAIGLARARLADTPSTRVIQGDFLTAPGLDGPGFDLITCVATLHHLPTGPALVRMRALLRPGGRLRIIGLSANKGVRDWIISAVSVVPVRLVDMVRGASGFPDMTIARPTESLAEIRRIAATELPGSLIRRRFFYRYSLAWTAPGHSPHTAVR